MYHDDVHQYLTSVLSYTLQFLRYSLHKILKVTVSMAMSNQSHTITLPTYTPQPLSLQSIYFQCLTVSPDNLR